MNANTNAISTRALKSTISAAIAAAAVAAMLAVSAAPAEAKGGRNARIIGGIAAGLIGAAIAHSAVRAQPGYGASPVYDNGPGYGGPQPDECHTRRRPVFDRWGEFRGYRYVSICD